MLPQEVIRRKRDGEILEPDEIAGFIAGIGDGSIGEAQIAAFAMTVRLNGMTPAETVAMTLAMRDSGTVLSWPGADRPVADKHSTGGVGDNVSLMLAPIAAACGLTVPMISGRGLGHTGGTLDKLQSIPGYEIAPDAETLRRTVETAGAAIIGQTAALAPADGRLYAVRDITATVDSVPLITASILSKKLAAGLGSLVLDVKLGNGAFMTGQDEAEALARSLVDVGNGAGLPTRARLTDMSEPLADSVGNAREVEHALAFLRGEKAGTRIETVVLALAADMLLASGRATSWQAGHERARSVLASGEALDRLGRMIHALGGPADFVEHPDRYLAPAPERLPVVAARSGYIAGYRTRDIGLLLIEMGGGRLRAEDGIDHRVGLTHLRPVGTRVEAGDLLATLHAASPLGAEQAAAVLAGHIHIAEEAPATRPVLVSEIT
ncbi:thymidine phosphorylase [Rhizobium sp. SG2393]|uniref:thymidine phosphorylase n=1 Tax=Rhizobium sp. SG2393 TaxID=3276279 RepID=UPI00366C36C2